MNSINTTHTTDSSTDPHTADHLDDQRVSDFLTNTDDMMILNNDHHHHEAPTVGSMSSIYGENFLLNKRHRSGSITQPRSRSNSISGRLRGFSEVSDWLLSDTTNGGGDFVKEVIISERDEALNTALDDYNTTKNTSQLLSLVTSGHIDKLSKIAAVANTAGSEGDKALDLLDSLDLDFLTVNDTSNTQNDNNNTSIAQHHLDNTNSTESVTNKNTSSGGGGDGIGDLDFGYISDSSNTNIIMMATEQHNSASSSENAPNTKNTKARAHSLALDDDSELFLNSSGQFVNSSNATGGVVSKEEYFAEKKTSRAQSDLDLLDEFFALHTVPSSSSSTAIFTSSSATTTTTLSNGNVIQSGTSISRTMGGINVSNKSPFPDHVSSSSKNNKKDKSNLIISSTRQRKKNKKFFDDEEKSLVGGEKVSTAPSSFISRRRSLSPPKSNASSLTNSKANKSSATTSSNANSNSSSSNRKNKSSTTVNSHRRSSSDPLANKNTADEDGILSKDMILDPAERPEGWIGAYSPESRKLRIQKFLEKRNHRVWTKKVKYDVRKNFADSRLRVKGRFVKKEDELLMRDLIRLT